MLERAPCARIPCSQSLFKKQDLPDSILDMADQLANSVLREGLVSHRSGDISSSFRSSLNYRYSRDEMARGFELESDDSLTYSVLASEGNGPRESPLDLSMRNSNSGRASTGRCSDAVMAGEEIRTTECTMGVDSGLEITLYSPASGDVDCRGVIQGGASYELESDVCRLCSNSLESERGSHLVSDNSCVCNVTFLTLGKDDIMMVKGHDETDIEIGRGRFGKVMLGLMKGNPDHVAVKQIIKTTSQDVHLEEAKILKYLEDTGSVPRLYGVVNVNSVLSCLVQEYYGKGFTLLDLLKAPEKLPETLHWISLAYQLVEGLDKIHRKKVILNDIKINNVLIDMSKIRAKYIDVGQATVNVGRKFNIEKAPKDKYPYLAPEVKTGALTTDKSDIYSLCFMMHQMSVVTKTPKLMRVARLGAATISSKRPSLSQLRMYVTQLLNEYSLLNLRVG